VNVDRLPCGSTSSVTVQGTTLEQPPSQPNGGGFNSTLSAGTITLGTPLANGASIDVRFLFGIQQTGTYKIGVVIETAPGAGLQFSFTGATDATDVPDWVAIPGAAVDIAGGAFGQNWALGTAPFQGGNLIYQYIGPHTWYQNIPGGAAQIAVASDGGPWVAQNAASSYAIYRRLAGVWTNIPGAAVDISAGASVYALGTTTSPGGNLIYIYVGGSSVWANIPGAAAQLAANTDNSLWAVQTSNGIFHNVGGVWTSIPGAATRVAAGGPGGTSVFALGVPLVGGDHQIYRYVGAPTYWQAVPGVATDLAVDGNGVLWARQASNAIYRCTSC